LLIVQRCRVILSPVSGIRTERLELSLLPEEFLAATAEGRRDSVSAEFAIAEDWWRERRIASLRLEDLRSDEAYRPWSLRAIILAESNLMIGFCGFHTAPNPPYLAEWALEAVEISYTVFPAFRGRGFATEAARGLMRWSEEHGVKRVVASIGAGNAASAAIAKRLGFVRVGTYIDPEDGPEDVCVADLG
jgi:[ribosomal protein S5]-alanine N-acetyltransferase